MQGEKSTLYTFLFNLYQTFYRQSRDESNEKEGKELTTVHSVTSQRSSFAPPLEAPVEISSCGIAKSHSTSALGSIVPTLPYLPEELTQLD